MVQLREKTSYDQLSMLVTAMLAALLELCTFDELMLTVEKRYVKRYTFQLQT